MAKKAKQPVKQEPQRVGRFLHATPSLIFRGSVGILLGYAFLSRAFDTGSYWQYLGALVFTILGIRLLKRSLIKSYDKAKARRSR